MSLWIGKLKIDRLTFFLGYQERVSTLASGKLKRRGLRANSVADADISTRTLWRYRFLRPYRTRLTEADIGIIDRGIQRFMKSYRSLFNSIPPKLHLLEDHVVDQLKVFKHGLGLLNEQGGESSHKDVRKILQRYGGRSKAEILKKAVEKTTLSGILKLKIANRKR